MSDEERVAEILADWCDRRERGERVEIDGIARQHPDLAEALVRRLAAIEVFDRTFARPGAAGPGLLGDFRILREIGRGGMGIVYEAEQVSMRRRVALKVLSPATTLSERAVARFRREAQAAGRLHHTHIVPVYAMGEERGIWYYAMELVRGRTLAQVIEELRGLRAAPGAPSPPESSGFAPPFHAAVATQFAGVAGALETAHAEGIIHRDVKPSNLILDAGGVLMAMDFGLARVEGETAWRTLTGEVVGTPAYMSPEQIRGDAVDGRTDVYSLAATLCELLTLEAPFGGRELPEACANILSRDPVRPRRLNPRIPRDLETIVLKAMEKEPRRRYATAGDLARDLRAFAEGGTIRARRVGPLGRAWRRVRRHPLRSALVAAVVVLAATAAAAAVHARREASLRRALEYDRLCAEAVMTWRDWFAGASDGCVASSGDHGPDVEALLDRAISLDPHRIEAYMGRTFLADVPVAARLADLERARALGLGERTYRLARACILSGRPEEGAAEERMAQAVPPGAGYLDAYFEGRLHVQRREWAEADARFSDALRSMPRLGILRDAALPFRAKAREERGDLVGALEDLSSATSDLRPSGLLDLRAAALWRRLGHEQQAEERFLRILEVARGNGTERHWTSLCDVCDCHLALAWAERASGEALRAFPDSAELAWRRAGFLVRIEREADARSVVQRPGGLRAAASHRGCEAQALVLSGLSRHEEALLAAESALDTEPDCPAAWIRKARVLSDLGREQEALAACDEGLRRTGTPRLWSVRGDVLAKQGRHTEAIAAYDRSVEMEPGVAGVLYNRANSLTALDRWNEATEGFDRVLAIEPAYPAALINRARCLYHMGRHEEALEQLERADESRLSTRNRCVKHEFLGNTLLALELLDDALAAYDRTVAIDAVWLQGHTGRSIALRRLGRHQEALAAAREAVRLGPEDAWAHVVLGAALDKIGDVAGALGAYDAALALDPEAFGPHLAKGQLLDTRGRPHEALPHFEAAVRLDPRSAEARNWLGFALNNLGRCAEGLASLDCAIEIDDRIASAHWARSYSLRRLGRPQDALRAARRAIEIDATSAHARFHAGASLRDLGDLRAAAAEFREAVRLDPVLGIAHNNLGSCLVQIGDAADAVLAFDAAIPLMPNSPNPRHGKGEAFLALGQPADALREFDEAVRIAPRWAVAHRGRGKALAAIGADVEALRAFDEVVKLQPDDAEAHVERGDVLERLHRFDDAIEAYTRAADLDPGWARPPGRRGYLRSLRHGPAEGVPDLERAVRIDPRWSWARGHLANALSDVGRFEDALASFAKLDELRPDKWRPSAKRAEILIGLGRLEEALSVCDAAIGRFESVLALRRAKVSCLLAMGEANDAARFAKESATGDAAPDDAYEFAYLLAAAGMKREFAAMLKRFGDPKDPVDAYTVAQAWAVLGDKEGALRALRAAAARGFHHRPAKLPPDPHFVRFRGQPGFEEALAALVPRQRQ